MNKAQVMFNQVNAVIDLLPKTEREMLPKNLVDFFKSKANISPEETIDITLPFEELDLTDETMLMLYHINDLLTKKGM